MSEVHISLTDVMWTVLVEENKLWIYTTNNAILREAKVNGKVKIAAKSC